MFLIMSMADIILVIIYIIIGKNHSSSITYQIKNKVF